MLDDQTAIPEPIAIVCVDELPATEKLYPDKSASCSVPVAEPPASDSPSSEADCPHTKYTSRTRRCRLLCPDGCGMQRVSSINRLPSPRTVITLACGHVRGEILPAKGISLENARSPKGLRLFPPELIGEHIWGRSRYC
jgi:hypothetical protein